MGCGWEGVRGSVNVDADAIEKNTSLVVVTRLLWASCAAPVFYMFFPLLS